MLKKVVLALFVLCFVAFFYFDLGRFFTLESIKANREALGTYTEEHYGTTVFLFIIIYCVQTTISLPGATILTLVSGFLFGSWLGTLYANLGASSGAFFAFLAARYLFRDMIEEKFGARLSHIQQGFSDHAFHYLLTLRLIPLFPFFLVNLASGLTRIRASTYFVATVVGILPGSFVYANAGRQLGSIETLKDIASPGVLGAFVLLGFLAMVPIFYKKWVK